MTKRVTGLFDRPQLAMDTLSQLSNEGFTEDQISMLMTDQTRGSGFNIEQGNKAGEGFAIGASLTGLAAAVAAGIAAAGVIAIPGLNLAIFGPLVAAFTGAGAGAATGGVIGALIGSGITEYEAKIYEEGIKEGAVLIAVDAQTDEQEKRAREILRAHAAKKIAA